ncbi:hypothetical protein HU186_13945 [Bacillus paralicheniformis]|uniref:hypothetical protein n=1 Tax=Bacillus paralicheniformis TaxID=1648923 RepID=UPI001CC4AF74|nr:hypothetical protein [Bacillus paralicheniformis]MBZ5215433.1 hypothetical protein [Bacillus paralicheniformis]
MKKMKTHIFSVAILGLLSLVMAIPTLAASKNYSFTMEYRVVNGATHGKFFTLKAGKAKISGKQWQFKADPYAVGPNNVHYELKNKTTGNSFGQVVSKPYAENEKDKKVSGTYSGLGGGNRYYLMIWKVEDDGRDIKGNGSVYN